jgi:hypothetical protein
MSAEGSQKIDRAIAELRDWRGPMLAEVRRIFLKADPSVTEEWKWMGTPTWECDGIVAIANAHAGKVKVTFAKGARLRDPKHVFNSGFGGGVWRAIDLAEGARLPERLLVALIQEAIAVNHEDAILRRLHRSKKAAPQAAGATGRTPSRVRRPR